MMFKLIKITSQYNNIRLDKFLVEKFSQYSRAYLQKLIGEGKVLVNEKTVKSSYRLVESDKLKVDITEPEKINLTPDASINLDIVYEDNDIMVINKPAGMVMHPSETHKSKTLVNCLLAYYPEMKNIGEDKLRPGIVHRLDKDTSGLVIIVKNNIAFNYFKNLFKNREIEKKYLTLVKGNLPNEQGQIDLKILRSKSSPKKQSISQSAGREAVTYYEVIKRFKEYDLVEATPKTGRMHQIRVHFNAIGHPVIGDNKYGSKNQLKALSRHFLHSYYLKFKLLNGNQKEIKIDLPEDLGKIIKTLT